MYNEGTKASSNLYRAKIQGITGAMNSKAGINDESYGFYTTGTGTKNEYASNSTNVSGIDSITILPYGITIAGQQIKTTDRNDIPVTSGKVSFDPISSLLTLDNATITATSDEQEDINIQSNPNDSSININMIGKNVITSELVNHQCGLLVGYYVKQLSIGGTGSLDINTGIAKEGYNNYGIDTSDSVLTLKDSVSLNITSSKGSDNAGEVVGIAANKIIDDSTGNTTISMMNTGGKNYALNLRSTDKLVVNHGTFTLQATTAVFESSENADLATLGTGVTAKTATSYDGKEGLKDYTSGATIDDTING